MNNLPDCGWCREPVAEGDLYHSYCLLEKEGHGAQGKHTPGPWTVLDERYVWARAASPHPRYRDVRRGEIVTECQQLQGPACAACKGEGTADAGDCLDCGGFGYVSQEIYNARLIAAAPELLYHAQQIAAIDGAEPASYRVRLCSELADLLTRKGLRP